MAVVISVKIMRGPGDSANAPFPASYDGELATNTIARVRPYAGTQSGVNSVIVVRYTDGRSLQTVGNYYVNESVSVLHTRINA